MFEIHPPTIGKPKATRREAARYLRCSERKIDRLIRAGKIKASNVGRAVLIDVESITQLAEQIRG